MRVLVLGGYGFIGQAVIRRLLEEGHAVTGLGRDVVLAQRLVPSCRWIGADLAMLGEPEAWLPHLSGIDVVVNAAGALQSGARDDVEAVQYRAMAALYVACRRSGVGRFIQISAPGAEEGASTAFFRTKGRADRLLKASGLEWTILRPGLVIDRNAYGGTALLRMLAAFPLFQPLVHSDAQVATVSMEDVVALIARAVKGDLPPGRDIDLVEGEGQSLRTVVLAFRRWLGYRAPLAVLQLPGWVGATVARIADGLGWLGWRSPLRSSAMQVVAQGIDGDAKAFECVTGRPARSLEATLRSMPATLQERWFARLYLVFPLVIAILSGFWLVSGVLGLIRIADAMALLVQSGFSATLARFCVVAGALVDIALGILVLVRPVARHACFGMIAVSLAYLGGASLVVPELWLDPLGPLVKIMPGMMLALICAIMLEER